MSESFQNLFPQGGPNTVAGQYFSGASYLYPLSSEGGVSVANVTFEPACRKTGTSTTRAGRSFYALPAGATIRSGASPPGSFTPAMW